MKKIISAGILLIVLICFNVLFAETFKLPDAGQTKCYDEAGNEITCPNKGEELYGQDANYSINPSKYTVKEINGDKVVIDENTGLVWMQHTADTNNDGTISWNDALNWQEGVDYCKNLNYAGYSDWRLPTIFELSTIVNYGTYNPAIDTTVFECRSSEYWTSTINPLNYDVALNINFYDGNDTGPYKQDPSYVRCVRGKLFGNSDIGRFENLKINGDEVVKDKLTGLMWQKSDDGHKRTWKEALEYCKNLTFAGYDNWRLPNIQELRSIVNYQAYNPSIDKTVFESMSYNYWSSTTDAYYPFSAWNIFFDNVFVFNNYKQEYYYVRCVRGGLSGNSDIGSFDCDSSHLDNCDSESECEEAGGYWYDNSCHIESYCKDKSLKECRCEKGCKEKGGVWINGKCYDKNSFNIIIKSGWNLKALPVNIENGIEIEIFNRNGIITIWKWTGNNWKVYSPIESINNLLKQYMISSIVKIFPGEGFWINASGGMSVNVGEGEEYGMETLKINTGWNFVGVGKEINKSDFTKFGGIKTLWKWTGSNWQVWSPVVEIMTVLNKYGISQVEKIEKGEGFWINK